LRLPGSGCVPDGRFRIPVRIPGSGVRRPARAPAQGLARRPGEARSRPGFRAGGQAGG